MDPIANLFTAIENGTKSNKTVILVPASKMKMAILNILKQQRYIKDFKAAGDKTPTIKIYLDRTIHHYRRVSKPSWRFYTKAKRLRPVTAETVIISTHRGLMTAQEAKKQSVGGEVIGKIT